MVYSVVMDCFPLNATPFPLFLLLAICFACIFIHTPMRTCKSQHLQLFSQVYRLPVSIFHFVPCDQKHSRTFDLSTTHLALAHHEITLRRVSVNRFDRKSVTLSFSSRRWTWVEKHRSLASWRNLPSKKFLPAPCSTVVRSYWELSWSKSYQKIIVHVKSLLFISEVLL